MSEMEVRTMMNDRPRCDGNKAGPDDRVVVNDVVDVSKRMMMTHRERK